MADHTSKESVQLTKPGNAPPVPASARLSNWQELIPKAPQEIAVTICSIGLIACFFAPWFKGGLVPVSGAAIAKYGASASWLWSIPVLSLATFLCHKNKKILSSLGIIMFVLVWVGVVFFLNMSVLQNTNLFAWGFSLTLLLSLGLLGLSGERRFTAPIELAVRKLGSRKADINSHWMGTASEVHFSADEFCSTLEMAVRAKEWPGVELHRIPYREAGVLSHKREYLRIIRQRHLFDVCASTFGKDYFFTLREGQIPAVVDLRAALVVVLALLVLLNFFIQSLGTYGGIFAAVFLVLFSAWFLFNILKMGMTKFDAALIRLPALGAVYEAYFRPDTYFQQDTRMVFLKSVSELVTKHVEDTASANGLKFIDCVEKQPVLDGLYRRSRRNVSEE